MNKYLYILGFAGAALFSACSTSDDLSIGETPIVDESKESVLIFEAGQNSEVPISLGIGQSRGNTRTPLEPSGSIDSYGYGTFDTKDGKYFGVFCLATGYQSSYEEYSPIENTWTKDDKTGLFVRMSNVPASVSDGNVTFKNSDATADSTYYYPMGNWMKYNFYAYYPRQNETVDANTTLSFSDNMVWEKYYNFDGSQDIIWGRAYPENADPVDPTVAIDAEPYSANYFRFKGNTSEYYPQMKFEHKLVQFRFFVRAANSIASAKNIRVRAMTIKGINHLALVIADKKTGNSGKLYWFGSSIKKEQMAIRKMGSDIKRFDQKSPFEGEAEAYLDSPLHITDDAIDVTSAEPVGYIMLAPPNVPSFTDRNSETPTPNNTKYELVVKVKYEDGTTKNENIIFTLNPPEGGFKEGKVYNIVISINV